MSRLTQPLALLALSLVLTSCSLLSAPQVKPTRYFVLTSERELGTELTGDVAIGVGPFAFPSYLARPQMVTRSDPNQIVFSSFDRWAEEVKSGFPRVFAADLGRVVGTSEIVVFPWYQTPLEYQVKGEVLRFEAHSNGEVVLECIWTVVRLEDKRYLLTRHTDLRRPVNPNDPDEVASRLSDLVADLAREIGAEILRLNRS